MENNQQKQKLAHYTREVHMLHAHITSENWTKIQVGYLGSKHTQEETQTIGQLLGEFKEKLHIWTK